MASYTGVWKKYQDYIVKRKNPKTGEIERRIRLDGKTVAQRINSFFVKYANYIALDMCMRFSEVAAKYTPPDMGKANISEKYYYRPIYNLVDMAKGLVKSEKGRVLHCTKEDFAALRNGYKFKVMNTKHGVKRGTVFAYTRGINEAKRASRISHRGLAKYSWGSMINNIHEDIKNQVGKDIEPTNMQIFRAKTLPPIFQRLARKSPQITKYQWGTYDWDLIVDRSNVKRIQFTITNRLAEIERYGQIAIKQGIIAATKYCEGVFRAIDGVTQFKGTERTGHNNDTTLIAVSNLRKELIRMFDTLQTKYGVERLHITKTSDSGNNLNIIDK